MDTPYYTFTSRTVLCIENSTPEKKLSKVLLIVKEINPFAVFVYHVTIGASGNGWLRTYNRLRSAHYREFLLDTINRPAYYVRQFTFFINSSVKYL